MKLLNILRSFKNDEAGAVTVDWVVLTAAIVGLGLVVMTTVSGGLSTAATDRDRPRHHDDRCSGAELIWTHSLPRRRQMARGARWPHRLASPRYGRLT